MDLANTVRSWKGFHSLKRLEISSVLLLGSSKRKRAPRTRPISGRHIDFDNDSDDSMMYDLEDSEEDDDDIGNEDAPPGWGKVDSAQPDIFPPSIETFRASEIYGDERARRAAIWLIQVLHFAEGNIPKIKRLSLCGWDGLLKYRSAAPKVMSQLALDLKDELDIYDPERKIVQYHEREEHPHAVPYGLGSTFNCSGVDGSNVDDECQAGLKLGG